jgi:hypothetical protein
VQSIMLIVPPHACHAAPHPVLFCRSSRQPGFISTCIASLRLLVVCADFLHACYVLAIRGTGNVDLANTLEKLNK